MCLFPLCCCIEHIFDEDAVAGGGIVDEHMGHCADQLAVLDDGTAGHALDDAVGCIEKLGIGDLEQQITAVFPFRGINFQNFHRILL